MKIIKKGKPPKINPDYFIGTCTRCHCEVECTFNEASYIDGDRPFDPGCYYVKCPQVGCDNNFLYLEEKK